jgi:hypothetical protein
MTDSRDDSGKKVIRAKCEVTKGSGNQVEKSAIGDFIGIWRGKTAGSERNRSPFRFQIARDSEMKSPTIPK